MKQRLFQTALLSVALCGAVVLSAQSPSTTSAIVGRAGTLTVTRDEVAREVLMMRRGGDTATVIRTATVEGLDHVTRTILDRKLLAADARSLGLDRETGVLEMTSRAVDLVLSDVLLNREVASLDVSDQAQRRFYQVHPDRFRTGLRRKARHIVVATREEALAARTAVQSGTPFAQYAAAHNVDATRSGGGDLGWVSPGTMVRQFDQALSALRVGEVSEVVRTDQGFHLITVEAIDAGSLPAFELVKDKVLDSMKADVVERAKARAREHHVPTIDRNALATLLQ